MAIMQELLRNDQNQKAKNRLLRPGETVRRPRLGGQLVDYRAPVPSVQWSRTITWLLPYFRTSTPVDDQKPSIDPIEVLLSFPSLGNGVWKRRRLREAI